MKVITALRSRANLQDPYGQRLMQAAATLIEDMAAEIETAKVAAHTIETLHAGAMRQESRAELRGRPETSH